MQRLDYGVARALAEEHSLEQRVQLNLRTYGSNTIMRVKRARLHTYLSPHPAYPSRLLQCGCCGAGGLGPGRQHTFEVSASAEDAGRLGQRVSVQCLDESSCGLSVEAECGEDVLGGVIDFAGDAQNQKGQLATRHMIVHFV